MGNINVSKREARKLIKKLVEKGELGFYSGSMWNSKRWNIESNCDDLEAQPEDITFYVYDKKNKEQFTLTWEECE